MSQNDNRDFPPSEPSQPVHVGPAGQVLALVFAMAFPTVATWLWFVVLSGQPAMQLVYGVSKLVQFSFPALWMFAVQRDRLMLARPTFAGLALGGAFGAAVVVAGLSLFYSVLRSSPLLAGAPAEIAEKLGGMGIRSPLAFLGLAVFYSLGHSLLEEYYWRWYVFGQLRRRVPVNRAILLSSLAFMSHHVLVVGQFLKGYGLATWLLSLSVAVGGAAWAWLYQRAGTLYGAWLSHMLVDAGLMWLGYEMWRSIR